MSRHPRIVLLVVLVLVLAVLGGRALRGQDAGRASAAPVDIRAAAANAEGLRVIVALAERRLRVVGDAGDTLLDAPVAVGSGQTLRAGGHRWSF